MSRGMVMLTFMVAAAVLCSYWPAMAEVTQPPLLQEVELEGPSCKKFMFCVRWPSLSCITDCCDTFGPTIPQRLKCTCWYLIERHFRDNLIDFQNYCGFKKPTDCPYWQENKQQEVAKTVEAIEENNNSKLKAPVCCEKDKAKIKNCMLNTTSIDQCCPTFKLMLGNNCECYKYADDLDNQVLITLESYCDVTNPCQKVQVM